MPDGPSKPVLKKYDAARLKTSDRTCIANIPVRLSDADKSNRCGAWRRSDRSLHRLVTRHDDERQSVPPRKLKSSFKREGGMEMTSSKLNVTQLHRAVNQIDGALTTPVGRYSHLQKDDRLHHLTRRMGAVCGNERHGADRGRAQQAVDEAILTKASRDDS